MSNKALEPKARFELASLGYRPRILPLNYSGNWSTMKESNLRLILTKDEFCH